MRAKGSVAMPKIIIGLIGYYQFIQGYPLGPELKARLANVDWNNIEIQIKEMNWGPIAIVQDFQSDAINYDRIVLVAAVDRKITLHSVTCRQWLGTRLDTRLIQDRIFEAVTGVISLDNLLVIGEHFKIWPKELITVEVQLSDTSFGDFVLSELEMSRHNKANIIGSKQLSPEIDKLIDHIVATTQTAVKKGIKGLPDIQPLSATTLTPTATVCHNQFVQDCYVPTAQN